VVFDGPFVKEDIEAFIKGHMTATFEEIGQENAADYYTSGLPLAYLFLDKDESRSALIKEIEPVAKEFKGKVNFVWVDASKYAGHASHLNLKESWPAFAIQELDKQAKYPFNQQLEVTSESIRDFVKAYVSNQLEADVKSSPIPEKNDGPVMEVVSLEFDKIVMDKSKDVLVKFYAPWCGHCKTMAPMYESLGSRFADQKDKIVVARMDVTVNDIPPSQPFTVEGFPTVKLFKAETNEIVDYDGERDEESIVQFLLANCGNKIDIGKKQEQAEEPAEEEQKHDEL